MRARRRGIYRLCRRGDRPGRGAVCRYGSHAQPDGYRWQPRGAHGGVCGIAGRYVQRGAALRRRDALAGRPGGLLRQPAAGPRRRPRGALFRGERACAADARRARAPGRRGLPAPDECFRPLVGAAAAQHPCPGRRRPARARPAARSRAARRRGRMRVHGGGFAGCVQALMPCDAFPAYKKGMEALFGPGSCRELHITGAK